MKNFLWTTLALVMCLFTACSDDDDDNKIPEGPTTTFAGKLPTKVGRHTFVYDENNRCIQIKDGSYVYCEIDYDKGVIISDDEEMKISFNSKGYLTEIRGKWDYEDEEGNTYKGDGKISFRYNSKGQLISSSQYTNESGKEDGESYSWKGTYESTYTWENGNLVKAVIEETDIEDGEKSEYGDTYTIKYSDEKNEVGQNTMAQAQVLELEDMDILSLIGMLGKASLYFPDSYTDKCYEKDGEQNSESEYNCNMDYTLNEDGTIKTERIDSYSYSYSYNTVTVEKSTGRSVEDNSKVKKLSSRAFFTRHHARK